MNRFTRFPDLDAACSERTPALSGTAASLSGERDRAAAAWRHRVAKPSSKPTAKSKEREEAETSARLSRAAKRGDPSGLRGQRPRSALRRRERLREAMCQAASPI